ncbi:Argonaute siRNA chaperone (ARC) complex subunit Arb1 [Geosmithia morbida]|uniref:Argonaute siRNA chaperone (ARC) complex subunit Arb1 n=1 Tax=Geosmithia morbida TaxID=1094350 RepID=A0A9P5D3Z4_9HYPO|nr:Argonaute siRNA chaperone (ARC) complex subunit Arb1 [Geosmithia morbida]KAF4123001.1 Argonaute siRNA chaperone (ARC) complex subunit Arb1 [Geosmithia morbida]
MGRTVRGNKTVTRRGPTALPRDRGTGFEEYYADPPVTPQEARDEKETVYSQRIQSCIKRFRARRRLRGDISRYFLEYLFLGGVNAQPQAFSGGRVDEDDDDDDAIIIPNRSSSGDRTDRFYDGDRENWSVDFAAVTAGFLTVVGPVTGFRGIHTAVSVVDNFLRYVLHHDVCPEFAHDVRKAIAVCEEARQEWPLLAAMSSALPGSFNLAAACSFGVNEIGDWSIQSPEPSFMSGDKREEAEFTWLAILALSNEPELYDRAFDARPKYHITEQMDCTVEITSIRRPHSEIEGKFKDASINGEPLKPLGKIVVKPAHIEDGWAYHVRTKLPHNWAKTLFFEQPVLDNLRVGNKMTVTLCDVKLPGDGPPLTFVKTIHDIVPTFYTFLPQQLMRHFKPPKEIEKQVQDDQEEEKGQGDKEDRKRYME